MKNKEKIFSVAPMMDWTDRHCRYFHRLMTRHALLYSEMVVADAVIMGDREMLLGGCDDTENVALQLGGSDPVKLAEAARIAVDYGFVEINLNVGCPSDRVKSGTFGAVLMLEPERVGRCVAAMTQAVDIPITVKCRLGVDDQDIVEALDSLSQQVWNAGCERLWVHARKAWLEGLSPKENRMIPPLNYDRVGQLKAQYADRFIGLNGGIETLEQCEQHFECFDGVMLGRAGYHNPGILRHVDRQLFEAPCEVIGFDQLCEAMGVYADQHLASGGRLHQITRHMLGLFHGMPGARRYRQILSVEGAKPGAGPEVITSAFAQIAGNTISSAA